MHIRHASTADAGTLAKLAARTFRDAFAADNEPADMEAYVRESSAARRGGSRRRREHGIETPASCWKKTGNTA